MSTSDGDRLLRQAFLHGATVLLDHAAPFVSLHYSVRSVPAGPVSER